MNRMVVRTGQTGVKEAVLDLIREKSYLPVQTSEVNKAHLFQKNCPSGCQLTFITHMVNRFSIRTCLVFPFQRKIASASRTMPSVSTVNCALKQNKHVNALMTVPQIGCL